MDIGDARVSTQDQRPTLQLDVLHAAMSQTVRQMIIDILLERPATAKDLSARVRIPDADVWPHLAHLRNSLQRGRQRLVMEPASCRTCGVVCRTRERVRQPGRCPACHYSVLEEPVYRIQTSGDAR